LRFLLAVRRKSGENWGNALECTCHLAHLILNAGLRNIFRPLEMLPLLIAVLTHRVESCALPDSVSPEMIVALLKKCSVIEARTCQTVLGILARPDCNLFGWLVPEDGDRARELTVELLLAFDWVRHLELIESAQKLDLLARWQASAEGRLIVMKLLLRGATMLNTVQSIDYADNWAEQVMRQERVQLCSTEFRYDKDLLFKKCREPLFEIP
jgi:hypothetical protein